jgi:hypothetical protein
VIFISNSAARRAGGRVAAPWICGSLEAVINFSALQRFPIEQGGFMNSSSRISMKYFSDFYISYRRGVGAGTEAPDLKAAQRLL